MIEQPGTVFMFDKIEISTHFTYSGHLRHIFYQKYDWIKSFLQDCDINTKVVSFTLYLYVNPTACNLELLFLSLSLQHCWTGTEHCRQFWTYGNPIFIRNNSNQYSIVQHYTHTSGTMWPNIFILKIFSSIVIKI